MSVLINVFGSCGIGVVRHPSVGEQLLQLVARLREVRRAIRGLPSASYSPVMIWSPSRNLAVLISPCATAARNSEVVSVVPDFSPPSMDTTIMKPTVISTIHSVGVRATLRRGLSGWLSWGSSRWAETARAPARTRGSPLPMVAPAGVADRGHRMPVSTSSVTRVYEPVRTCTVCGTGVGGPPPARRDGDRPRTSPRARSIVNRPCASVDDPGRRAVGGRRQHVAVERAIRAWAVDVLDGTGRPEHHDAADPGPGRRRVAASREEEGDEERDRGPAGACRSTPGSARSPRSGPAVRLGSERRDVRQVPDTAPRSPGRNPPRTRSGSRTRCTGCRAAPAGGPPCGAGPPPPGTRACARARFFSR